MLFRVPVPSSFGCPSRRGAAGASSAPISNRILSPKAREEREFFCVVKYRLRGSFVLLSSAKEEEEEEEEEE